MDEQKIENLLIENIRYSREILADTKKIKHYMFVRMIINIIFITLTVVPIILALFWLPSAIRSVMGPISAVGGDSMGTLDLLKQLQQLK